MPLPYFSIIEIVVLPGRIASSAGLYRIVTVESGVLVKIKYKHYSCVLFSIGSLFGKSSGVTGLVTSVVKH